MAFEPNALVTTINWENVRPNRVTMITGRGQMVYWKGCNVSVIEKNNEGKEQTRRLEGMPDGEGLVNAGTELYVTDGKVIEA